MIKAALGKSIDGEIDLRFGGSVIKHTDVNGLSDIDALVILNGSELEHKSPEEVKAYFLQQLQDLSTILLKAKWVLHRAAQCRSH